MILLNGASKVLCDYIGKQLIKYKSEGLKKDEKKILKDCIKALDVLGFADYYYSFNKRFKAIENTKVITYEVYKKNVLIKQFKSKKEALDFYNDLLPFAEKDELELTEKEQN